MKRRKYLIIFFALLAVFAIAGFLLPEYAASPETGSKMEHAETVVLKTIEHGDKAAVLFTCIDEGKHYFYLENYTRSTILGIKRWTRSPFVRAFTAENVLYPGWREELLGMRDCKEIDDNLFILWGATVDENILKCTINKTKPEVIKASFADGTSPEGQTFYVWYILSDVKLMDTDLSCELDG